MSAAFERLTGLLLRDEAFLALGLALLIMLGLASLVERARARRQGRSRAAIPLAPAGLLAASGPLPATWRTRLWRLPGILSAAGLVVLVVALARPSARASEPLRTEGIDLLLCVDVSSSMTARDVGGSRTRLEVAQEAAARFIARRPHDRIGLLAFARFPDLLCPPTRDHQALTTLLQGLAPVASDGPEDATGVGAAAARAVEALGGARVGSRVVILLTDGEENVALRGATGEIAPAHAAQLAEQLRVRIHVIAAGSDARPAGRPAPDLAPVASMAQRTGGDLYRARDARALDDVYATLDRLERAPIDTPRVILEDRHTPFLLAALALLLLGRLLAAGPLAVLS